MARHGPSPPIADSKACDPLLAYRRNPLISLLLPTWRQPVDAGVIRCGAAGKWPILEAKAFSGCAPPRHNRGLSHARDVAVTSTVDQLLVQGEPGLAIVDETGEGRTVAGVAQRVTSAAALLVGRRVLVTGLSVLATSVTARMLGVDEFGQLSSALATFYLLLAVSDFGFGLVLARRLSQPGSDPGSVSRAGTQLQLVWACALGVVTLGLALAAGLASVRGQVLLVLVPAVVSSGLVGLRQVFLAMHQLRPMAAIDVTTTTAQFAVSIAFALSGLGAVWIAGATAAGAIANSLISALVALRLVGKGRPTSSDRRSVLVEAIPLGVASVMSSAYFMVGMVLLPYLADEKAVGHYAAAFKVLSILVSVPGLIMNAALPGLAAEVADKNRLSSLVSRIWHLMAATAVPVCAAVSIFAPQLVELLFGPDYRAAVPLLRILSLAGVLSAAGSVLGNVLIARAEGRRMLAQNLCGLIFGLAATVVLVPVFGVVAAAWVALATELLILLASLHALAGRLDLRSALGDSTRPMAAIGAAMMAAVATYRWPVLAMAVAALIFVLVLRALDGWPRELRRIMPGRRR